MQLQIAIQPVQPASQPVSKSASHPEASTVIYWHTHGCWVVVRCVRQCIFVGHGTNLKMQTVDSCSSDKRHLLIHMLTKHFACLAASMPRCPIACLSLWRLSKCCACEIFPPSIEAASGCAAFVKCKFPRSISGDTFILVCCVAAGGTLCGTAVRQLLSWPRMPTISTITMLLPQTVRCSRTHSHTHKHSQPV